MVEKMAPEDMVSIWERNRGSLSKVLIFTPERKKKCSQRIAQGVKAEDFERAVKLCATTPFLRGENQRGWRADFDWLITNSTNYVKVLEGKYDGQRKKDPFALSAADRSALEELQKDGAQHGPHPQVI